MRCGGACTLGFMIRIQFVKQIVWAVALLSSTSAAVAQNPSTPGDAAREELQWRASEQRLQHTYRVALELMDSPGTMAIRSALEKSQTDWDTFRESHCRLTATLEAFNRAFDERNVQRCRSSEALKRTRYIQNIVP